MVQRWGGRRFRRRWIRRFSGKPKRWRWGFREDDWEEGQWRRSPGVTKPSLIDVKVTVIKAHLDPNHCDSVRSASLIERDETEPALTFLPASVLTLEVLLFFGPSAWKTSRSRKSQMNPKSCALALQGAKLWGFSVYSVTLLFTLKGSYYEKIDLWAAFYQ